MNDLPNLNELTRVSARVGILSFGGPAAQIALMHKEFVADRSWISEKDFLRALSFCMLLPGPEAMQLATYIGWRLHGIRGGTVAGTLFVLPGACVILLLAGLYVTYGSVPLVQSAFLGIKATVVVIVAQALLRLSQKTLTSSLSWALATLSFTALFLFSVPFPLVVITAGCIGAIFARDTTSDLAAKPTTSAVRITLIGGALWLAPLLIVSLLQISILVQIGTFFATLAVVSFGGAYAVLAYMTQEVVTGFGWIATDQMIDALGLAETTPGPLILVTQFVAFLAGFAESGWTTAALAAGMALWMTFVPCFVWIFLGAPYLEWISSRQRLSGALTGISAAVVGVILNVGLWFAFHVVFDQRLSIALGPISAVIPDIGSVNTTASSFLVISSLLLLRFGVSVPKSLALMALLGASIGLIP